MKNQKSLFFLATLLLISTPFLCESRADEPVNVHAVMKRNFEALTNLQSYIADPKIFADSKNREAIQKNLDSMAGFQHAFPKKMAGQEPGLAAIASLFSDYLKDVQKSFKEAPSSPYVRNQIRTMTGFCLSCHTRVSSSQSFVDVQSKVDTSPLSDFQKAEFYAATRQFDKAIQAFDRIISTTSSNELGYIELGRAVREVLSVTIRVKQDPKASFFILEKLSTRKDLPDFFERYVEQWKKDVTKWMQEKKRPKDMSVLELMVKAKALVKQADERKLFTLDPSADVNYLRATNYVHEALQKEPTGAFRAEALYILGTCYDALQDPMLWALDSLYFEACIHEFPHSDTSKKCYRRYASKLYFSYSGSGGTFVPDDELKKLSELRKLSL